ncbi:MAG: DEAD/DEAH box helicase [Nitrososphaerota archaeon]|nr:DEAD/DEAH box helicase [Nitrososphaerota archaeon]
MRSLSGEEVISMLVEPVAKLVLDKGLIPLTEPQVKAIPEIVNGNNVLIVAPTGIGKTEAALLPILSMMVKERINFRNGVFMLYITPLRALNRDLVERISWWAGRLDFKLSVRHGDTPSSERRMQSLSPPHILVTTPETFQIMLIGSRLRNHLKTVRWVVVDELHEIASDKRGSQLSLGLERLKRLVEGRIQIIGLSATIGEPEKLARFLVGLEDSFKVIVTPVPKDIEISLALPEVSDEDYLLAERLLTTPEVSARLRVVREILSKSNALLLFTNTRATAEALSNRLLVMNLPTPVSIHHGSLGVEARVRAEEGLKEGELRGLVCTSSLELGIDIGLIDFVIQYGSPRQTSRLIQRIGRSGHRIGLTSRGMILCMDEDDAIESMVIRRRALNSIYEPVSPPEAPYDILAHQIVGMLLEKGQWSVEEMLEIIRKSTPYSSFSREEFERILDFLSSQYPRLLFFEKYSDTVRPGRRRELIKFFFEHISSIPEVKQYPVFNEDENLVVGNLDEEFVAEKGLPGTKFVMGGLVWSIIQVFNGKVIVKKADDPLGAVPFWTGEEIPVTYETAMEVGALRRLVEEEYSNGRDLEKIAGEIAERYGVEKEFSLKVVKPIIECLEKKIPIGTDRRIVFEKWGDYTIIHACLGDLGNRALSKIVGSIVLSEVGLTVPVSRDPYRVMVERVISPTVIIDRLKTLDEKGVMRMLLENIENVGLFKRRFLHVARRMGIVEKDADLTSIRLESLIRSSKESIVYDEAVKELLSKDYDIKPLMDMIKGIASGEIETIVYESEVEPSPLAKPILRQAERHLDIYPPEKVDKIVLMYASARLRNTPLELVCSECGLLYGVIKPGEFTAGVRCSRCGGRLGVNPTPGVRIRRGKSKRIKSVFKKIVKTAELLEKYGVDAALALAGRGLSLKTVEKILVRRTVTGEDITKMIVDAERRRLQKA